jgi:hypothetical protein
MSAQDPYRLWRQRDGPTTEPRLRLAEDHAAPGYALGSLLDVELAGVEVEVAPAQS